MILTTPQNYITTPWKLPNGWEWIPLGEICDIAIGGTPSRNNPEYWGTGKTWISIADLNGSIVESSKEEITELGVANSNVKLVKPNTILMSFKLTIGKLGIAGKYLYTNEAIAALPIKNDWQYKMNLDFLFRALGIVPLAQEADVAVKGKTLNKKKLAQILIPVPFPNNPVLSLDIQDRLVSRIESLLGELKGDHQLLDKIRRDTSRFLEMKLEEILENLQSVRQPLIDVIESPPRNGWSPKCDDNPNGTPVLKLGAVLRFQYNPDEFKRTSLPTDPNAHYWLKPGDVLISRSNTLELVGHAAIYSGTPFPCIYPDLMMRIRVDQSKADSRFLVYWLQSKEVRHFIQSRASGASPTMKKINQGHVCNIPFPIISVEEQRQLAHYLESLQSEVNEMLKTMQQDAKLLERLEQSILEKAFQGQL